MKNKRKGWLVLGATAAAMLGASFFIPQYSYADLVSSLGNLKMQLTGIVLPLLSVIGIGLAAISFFSGNPQAKQHIVYAILGCCFGFGADAIVNFIASSVH
jgi:hypothetical protein